MQGRIPTCSSAHICRTNKTFGLKTTCGEQNLNQERFGFRPLGANLLPGALPRWSTSPPQPFNHPPASHVCFPPQPTNLLPPTLTARCLYCRPQGRREAPGGGVGFRVTGGQSLFAQVIVSGEGRPRQSVASSGALSSGRES